MAFALNRAQLIGNVTRDPEVRQTTGGASVATFGVATNFSWKDSTGNKKEKVEFHNIVVWGKLAEICQQYVRKGRKVYVEGRIETRTWEAEDGQKKNRTEINADNFILLDGKRGDAAGSNEDGGAFEVPQEKGSLRTAKKGAEATDAEEISVEDLPF